jgi:hypothetical protein
LIKTHPKYKKKTFKINNKVQRALERTASLKKENKKPQQ